MTTREEKLDLALLDNLILAAGAHDRRSLDAVCVMEAVAWLAGEPHSDHPACASPTIAAFLRAWNDAMNEDDRQMLKPLIPKLVGTSGTDAQELERSYMALDWYCRVSAPAWLRLAGLTAEAEAIEATAPIVDAASAKAAQEALDTARSAAAATRNATSAAASAATWDATSAAASAATWDAASAAASAATWDATWDAVSAAVSAAASAAVSAATWDAVMAKLRPTVEQLQASAIELVERMIAVTIEGEPVALPGLLDEVPERPAERGGYPS